MDGKVCNACGEFKPLDAFNRRSRNRDGRSSICRECDNAYQREWRHRNAEKFAEYRRRDYLKHGEARKAHKHAYYIENREYFKAYNKRYREEHGDIIRKMQRMAHALEKKAAS